MTRGFTDWQEGGIWPLQDHDGGVPVEIRQTMVGGRITKMHGPENSDDPEESWVEFGLDNDHGTLGDVHPWLFWQTAKTDARGMGSWSMAWGGITVGGGGGGTSSSSRSGLSGGGRGGFFNIGDQILPKRRSPTSGSGAGSSGSKKTKNVTIQPLANSNADPDSRYVAKTPGWPKCFNTVPQGIEMMVVPATAESSQQEVMLWADPRIIAPSVEGPAECGTLVVDLQPEAEPCMDSAEEPGKGGRAARIQSAFRVIARKPDDKKTPGGPPPPTPYIDPGAYLGGGTPSPGDLVTPGGQAVPGLSKIGVESGNGIAWNLSTSALDKLPGYGMVWAKMEGASRPTGTDTRIGERTRTVGSGGQGDAAQGPCKFGEWKKKPEEKHGIAFVAHLDAWGPIHAGHADDKHRIDKDRDGHAMNSAHLSTEALWYRSRDEDGPFYFQGEYPVTQRFPLRTDVELVWDEDLDHNWINGPREGKWRWISYTNSTSPPTIIRDPEEPRPPGPGVPSRPGRPGAPGGPPPPVFGPGTPRGGRPRVPGTPATPRSDAPPTANPPEVRRRGQDIFVLPGGGFYDSPPPSSSNFTGPGGPSFATGYDEVGQAEVDDVSVYVSHHPLHESFAELSFRPQVWYAGAKDFARNPNRDSSDYELDELSRPSVLSMHTWGAQNGAEWIYTKTPWESRARGGTAAGGVLFAPPHLQMEDFLTGGPASTTATSTTAYIAAAPNVVFAFGEPHSDGGMTAASVVISQDLSDDNRTFLVQQLDSNRSEQSLIEAYLDQASDEISVTIGGTQALNVPRGTTAQRPATPAGGAIRMNSSGAADVIEFYDSQGASWTQLGTSSVTDFVDLGDGPGDYGSSGDVLVSSGSAVAWETPTTTSAGGANAGDLVRLDGGGHLDNSLITFPTATFTAATDTPSSYAGSAGFFVVVNSTPDGVEFIEPLSSSAGAGDAGKPIVLDAGGHVDATMINDGDIDHGSLGGLPDDDHSQYIHDTPTTTARNTIKPSSASVVPLTLQATLTHTADLFAIDTAVTPSAFTVDKNASCTAYGFDASSQKITSVASGTASTDAINLGQLDGRIDSGTSFPGSPTDGQKFYRTDLQRAYIYFGTRGHWLSEEVIWRPSSFNAGGLTNSNWLRRENGTALNYAPFVMLNDAVLCEYTGSSSGTVVDVEIRIGTLASIGASSITILHTIYLTSSGSFSASNVDVDFSSGDLVAVSYNATLSGSNSLGHPTADLGFRWKAT